MHQLNETGKCGEQHHQALENSEGGRVALQLGAARSKTSHGTDRPGTRRVRVVPAPGGFAYVED